MHKPIHLFLSISLLGTLSCTPVASSSPTPALSPITQPSASGPPALAPTPTPKPTPAPANPQGPDPLPSDAPVPASSLGPTVPPDDTPATLGHKTIIAQNRNINGPIQDFKLGSSGNGWLLWHSLANNQNTLQGAYMIEGQLKETISYPLDSPATFWPKSAVNAQGKGVTAWNPLPMEEKYLPFISSLPLDINPSTRTEAQLKKANLLALAIDENQNGHLLASQELQIDPDAIDPNNLYSKSTREALYLYPVSQGKVDFSKPRLIQQHDDSYFVAASIDLKGNGLLITLESTLVISFRIQKVKDFQPVGTPDRLGFSTERESIRLNISDGNGYVSQLDGPYTVRPITNYELLQKSPGEPLGYELNFPTFSSYSEANQAAVPSWDVAISRQGEGFAVWTDVSQQRAFYQNIKDFQFVGAPRPILPHNAAHRFGVLRASYVQGQKRIAVLEAPCTFTSRASRFTCVAQSGSEKTLWTAQIMDD